MDLGSIFILLATLILVVLFVSRPFFDKEAVLAGNRSQGGAEDQEHQRSYYLAERDRILTALQELDFDNTLGKIPEEEYPVQRASLLQRGAEVLRNLDALQEESYGKSAEDRMEEAIAARRLVGQAPASSGPTAGRDDDLEELIASRRRQREENAAGFCPHCGKPVQKSDRFCPKCGTNL